MYVDDVSPTIAPTDQLHPSTFPVQLESLENDVHETQFTIDNEFDVSFKGTQHVTNDLSIIVHSHLRWDFVWQRPQQIFSRLARDHCILFLEDPLWEQPRTELYVTEPCSNVVRVIPAFSTPACPVDEYCEKLIPLLREALRSHALMAGRFEKPIQWFYSPMTAPVMLDKLEAVSIVYDCMDELANFRFAPADIGERERMLLSKANVVFTGGYQLYQSKLPYHSNIHFYGCGVDVAHFGKARQAETQVPAEVANLPRPILGYFGVIDERIDYQLLERLAEALPHASVVMVGPFAKIDEHAIPKYPNIHWLGQRSYAELPSLVKSYDVCLMPFAINDATRYINPTKTLEYMAAGRPIVSTPVPDVVRNFAPIVEVAETHDDFIAAVDRATSAPDAARVQAGIERASRESWDEIVRSMRRNVITSIAPALVPKSFL